MRKIDVGLMPMPENEITKGKGGFKLIQYMGLGIVSVASAITINKEIIDHGINGFLVEPKGDWVEVLKNVISQRINFANFGANARKKIINHYSFEAHKNKVLSFICRS